MTRIREPAESRPFRLLTTAPTRPDRRIAGHTIPRPGAGQVTFLFRRPRRAWFVVSVFFSLFIAPALRLPGADDRSGPVRTRVAFERLGGAWIKLGQMLALRFDLLPAAYCDELFKLLNQVAPFSYARGPGDRPPGVRRRPRADLPDVRARVVRGGVDRPGPPRDAAQRRRRRRQGPAPGHPRDPPGRHRDDVRADVAPRLDPPVRRHPQPRASSTSSPAGPPTSSTTSSRPARPCCSTSTRQGDRHERIARVHRDYTTSRVLTTEFIEGIPLIEIMIAKREGEPRPTSMPSSAHGHDLDRIVRHLDWNMLNQVFVFGYFHADLHPANLFVLADDAIGYVDFGIVGQLPDRVRDSLTRYSWLLFRGEVEARRPRADALAGARLRRRTRRRRAGS